MEATVTISLEEYKRLEKFSNEIDRLNGIIESERIIVKIVQNYNGGSYHGYSGGFNFAINYISFDTRDELIRKMLIDFNDYKSRVTKIKEEKPIIKQNTKQRGWKIWKRKKQ